MSPLEATREIMWNISYGWLMYVFLIPPVILLIFGCYKKVKKWRLGQPLNRFDAKPARIGLAIKQVLSQNRVARKSWVGFFHRFVVWGFIAFLIGTIVVALDHDFGLEVMKGYFYLVFQSLILDILGALVLIGLIIAAVRRWIIRPKNLAVSWDANLSLILLLAIIVTGFLLEGWRIAVTDDPWASWSPVGAFIAWPSAAVLSDAAMEAAHRVTWWIHLAMAFCFVATLPFTKLFHIFSATLNTYTANLKEIGANLKPLDVDLEDESEDEASVLGVNAINGFTWKDLLDLDACTGCGRCADNCPANIAGKSLSPRDIVLELKSVMVGQKINGADQDESTEVESGELFDVISPETLWECTTCAACVEVCPVYVEQMPKIIDMRRFQVMEESEFPETIQDAVMSLEERGHPVRGTRATRVDWAKGMDIPLLKDNPEAEILFWVGSPGALVERSQLATRAFAELLIKAGVNFAILGREEKSTGDLARRVGQEFLYQTQVEENVEILNSYNVKKIVTTCPHAYNTFRNEYPLFGGEYEVYHHSQYLSQLIQTGRLTISAKLDQTVTYHDPCYLSRHNHLVDEPRKLLGQTCQNELVEMARSGKESFCCGGGGGLSYADDDPDTRINRFRARQVLETGAKTVAVACPYCMTMMEDGIKAETDDKSIQVLDIAEMLAEAVGKK